MLRLILVLALLMWPSGAGAQFSTQLRVLDEGANVTPVRTRLNCTGAGIVCSDDPATAATKIAVGGGGATHNILSATHSDTTGAGTEVQGDILRRGATAWERLPVGANGEVLAVVSGVPAWSAASGGAAGLLTFSTLSVIDGTVTVYLGGTVSQNEPPVQMRLNRASGLKIGQLNCTTDNIDPSQDVTITARHGACGAFLTDDANDAGDGVLSCAITGTAKTCDSTAEMAVLTNECISLRVSSVAALSAPVVVTCTAERTG